MVTVGTAVDILMLAELIDTGNLLDGAEVGLFKSDIEITKDTVLADLTVADFSGYAPSAAQVWADPIVDQAGNAIVAAPSVIFHAATPLTVSNSVYGWYLVDSGGTVLLAAERFPEAVEVSSPASAVFVQPRWPAREDAPN
jgi:hypothetical protein